MDMQQDAIPRRHRQRRWQLGSALIVSCLLAPLTQAIECFTPASDYSTDSGRYFELDELPDYNDQQQAQLQAIYSLLDGKWQGTVEETFCSGTDEAPLVKTANAEVDAELTHTTRQLIMQLQKHYLAQHNIKGDKLQLFENGLTRDLEITDSSISGRSKFRQSTGPQAEPPNDEANTNPGWLQRLFTRNPPPQPAEPPKRRSRLVDNYWLLEFDSHHVDLTISRYINGIYVGTDKIQLTRQ